MSELKKPPRPRCEHCQRPASHCLCAYISRIPNRTQVLVLQHSDEASHALNTARLAVMGLLNARLLVGEHFPQLDDIVASAGRVLLLFPQRQASGAQVDAVSTSSSSSSTGEPAASLLIVPDGTWRKARKIVGANPVLDTLPRLSLPPGMPSEYRIRKTNQPAAVSTIEAIARSLSLLEPEQSFDRLLAPFRAQIAQQMQAMGEEVYRRNYTNR
ncbi:tRNA-uridine aminocarboxypropyltransferase [Advenella mimigardefordensis]|nr:tRNA-uridine aminocarboxypropyltransferase [Advenella mimigardefordensis]